MPGNWLREKRSFIFDWSPQDTENDVLQDTECFQISPCLVTLTAEVDLT